MIRERVFADTSGLFAAVSRKDAHHQAAATTLRKLVERDAQVCSTSYVLAESIALIQARIDFASAYRFEQVIRPYLHITWIESSLHAQAVQRWARRGRRHLSLVDCSSFVVMESLGIARAFALDSDFAEEGFELVPTIDHA